MRQVYFYTGSFTHTFYREIFRYPPPGFEFIPSSPDLTSNAVKKDIVQSARWYFPYRQQLEQAVLWLLAACRIPKYRLIEAPKSELIHSAQYPLLNRAPWVIDFEDVSTFTWYQPEVLRSSRAKKRLEGIFASPFCRAILPWTEAARQSLENGLNCKGFRHKIKVVYPVITPQSDIETIFKEKKASNNVKILFVGTAFYAKGGLETLRVVDKISRNLPVELAMVSNIPEDVKAQYSANPNIKFHSRIPGPTLVKLYRQSHLFLAPYHTDTFGFSILEAFSYGLACVATDQFAAPEIVTDGQSGLIIKNSISRFGPDYLPKANRIVGDSSPLIDELKRPDVAYLERLEKALVSLVNDRGKLEHMGRRAYQEVATGRFSPQKRLEAMASVYKEALLPLPQAVAS